MKFLSVQTPGECSQILASKIGECLSQNQKVLWLVSGGSNIQIFIGALEILKSGFKKEINSNLVITLTDERYGPINHPDSNWTQLIQAGLDISCLKESVPVLFGGSFEATTRLFSRNYLRLSKWADVIIGQFGIGVDGHIAGVLPGTIGVDNIEIACSYSSTPFQRITLTLNSLKKISIALTFALGKSKQQVIRNLRDKNISLQETPAQILKLILKSYLYTDQL